MGRTSPQIGKRKAGIGFPKGGVGESRPGFGGGVWNVGWERTMDFWGNFCWEKWVCRGWWFGGFFVNLYRNHRDAAFTVHKAVWAQIDCAAVEFIQ